MLVALASADASAPQCGGRLLRLLRTPRIDRTSSLSFAMIWATVMLPAIIRTQEFQLQIWICWPARVQCLQMPIQALPFAHLLVMV